MLRELSYAKKTKDATYATCIERGGGGVCVGRPLWSGLRTSSHALWSSSSMFMCAMPGGCGYTGDHKHVLLELERPRGFEPSPPPPPPKKIAPGRLPISRTCSPGLLGFWGSRNLKGQTGLKFA